MKKIFKSFQIKEIDDCTIKEEKIITAQLMERASVAVFNELVKELDKEKRIVVFAGNGNNGGDTFVISRLLLNEGYNVEVYFIGDEDSITDECRANRSMVDNFGVVDFLSPTLKIPSLSSQDQVIDGILGAGINRPVSGFLKNLIKTINSSGAKVYSIDLPSGLFCENNELNDFDAVIKSDVVFSMLFPKLSLLLPHEVAVYKQIRIVDIGLSQMCIDALHSDYKYIEQEDVRKLIRLREPFSHKGVFGHAMLIVGSYGKIGAAILASKACLRAGVGLLTVYLPKCGLDVMQTTVPEAMVQTDIDYDCITELGENDWSKFTIGIGSGIGQKSQTKIFLTKLFQKIDKPIVIDADALNMIATDKKLQESIPRYSILTPHPIEFDRLAQEKSKNSYDRLQKARNYASKNKVYIVLKGANTAIITPQKEVFFNSTGNPGMATGGSGDALTGIITSLLAQKYAPLDAALIGTYIHGYAGDLASHSISQYSLLPSDLIEHIGKAYLLLKK